MRARPVATLLLLAVGLAGCADTTAPRPPDGASLRLALAGPQLVSPVETAALAAAFDRVDTYDYQVVDSATFEEIATGTIEIEPGSTFHALDLSVSDAAFGRTVQITLVARASGAELYRSVVHAVLSDELGTIRVDAEIRYTGPGVRGTVRSGEGAAIGGVPVSLVQDQLVLDTAVTEADGTYLFVGVEPGTYQIQPTPPVGSVVCPAVRAISLGTPSDVVVTDFRTQADPCGTTVLVLSGGDFDETAQVATLLDADPDLTAETTFFYVNQLPSLDLLARHDVVLLFMNGIFDESDSMGDRVAEYVDIGGNLVVASFYFQGRSDSGLGSVGWGRLETMDPFLATPGGATYQRVALGSVLDPFHPIMQGVSTLTSTSYSSGVVARQGTTVLATWSDGAPLVGYARGPAAQRIVAVSLFPAATQTVTGDAQTLWINAVSWAGAIGGPG